MAATVMACALTEVVVMELSALEQVRRFPPPQGEDWLVGMAPPNEDVVTVVMTLEARVFDRDLQAGLNKQSRRKPKPEEKEGSLPVKTQFLRDDSLSVNGCSVGMTFEMSAPNVWSWKLSVGHCRSTTSPQ